MRYALNNDGEGSFAIDPPSGLIRTVKPLDRESVAVYNLIVVAVDRGTPALTGNFSFFFALYFSKFLTNIIFLNIYHIPIFVQIFLRIELK